MSTFIKGLNLSKNSLKVSLFVLVALVCAVAITLGVVFSQKQNYVATPENNTKVEMLDDASLLSSGDWNNEIALQLSQNLANVGDNVALGNAGGLVTTNVISLGGIDWLVVYKQNGIITLYANEAVANIQFDNNSNIYSESAVRDYLNNVFYPEFATKVGYENLESLIVPYGADELYYQAENAQSVPLNTVNNDLILNSNGVANDKVWLPSALEIGGFVNTENSPKSRVNSFKTIKENEFSINSGLWNLSNNSRLAVNNYALRSSVNNGVAVVQNGVITQGNANQVYAVRPCINLMLPVVENGQVKSANATTYVSSDVLFASVTPDYTDVLHQYTQEGSGSTFTPKTSGTVTLDGVTLTNSQALLVTLSDAVMSGQNMSGKTFKLSQDVDMSAVTVWNPIGRADFPFSGTFNGQGYKISNLANSGTGLVGLFGYVSSATISNVAVVDSSWYTTTNNVGTIAGTAVSSTIQICYSESGIAGGSNVGGIVGSASGSTKILNCYNLGGVAGTTNAGGIVGYNNGGTLTTVYNVAPVSVTSGSAVGGIVGSSASGTYSNAVYCNQNASQATISGVTGATYAAMQGSKTSSATNKPTACSAWTFDGNPWFISNVENDRLPMLKVFLKQVTLNVTSNDSVNQISIDGGTTYKTSATTTTTSLTTSVTIKARASFTTNAHYKLSSWELYDMNTGAVIAPTGITYASAGNPTASGNYQIFSLTLTLNDSYNLRANFVQLYQLSISPQFNGFSNTSSYAASELSTSTTATVFDGSWYEAGSTVTLTIGSPSNRNWTFAGLTGSTNGSSWSTVATSTTAGSFVVGSASPYTITVGHSAAYSSTNDSYIIRPNFNRYYNVTISNSIPTATGITMPTIVTQMTLGSTTIASNATGTKTGSVIYSGTVAAAVNTAATNYQYYLTFTNWTLKNGSTTITSSTSTSANLTIATQADSVINLNLVATFAKVKKTIKATENANNGIYTISTSGTLTSISADTTAGISVDIGATFYIYVLPSYSTGYILSSLKYGSAVQTYTSNTNGLYMYTLTANDTTTNTMTYTVTYALSTDFNVTLEAYVNTTKNTTFTFSPTTVSGNINTSLSSVTVKPAEANYNQYFLTTVTATYNGKTGTIATYSRPTAGYTGLAGTQNVFANLGTKTIAGLISAIGATPAYNVYGITVKVTFINVVRTITVTETWNGVSSSGATTTITHAKAYTLTDTTTSTAVTGQGTYNNAHQLVATPGTGYKVSSITLTGATAGDKTITNSSWSGSTGTLTFTLDNNATIAIVYQARPYTVTVTDNLSSLSSSLSNAYNFTIGGTASTPASGNKLYVNYGNAVTLTGYDTLKTITSGVTKAQLKSIVVTGDGGLSQTYTGSSINTVWSKTMNDENDVITITLTYTKLQTVDIYLQDASGESTVANASLVILTATDNSDRIIMLVQKGVVKTVDCVDGKNLRSTRNRSNLYLSSIFKYSCWFYNKCWLQCNYCCKC